MINANFFLGYPSDFKEICQVYPPKVKDILQNKNFSIYSQIFTVSQEDIEDEAAEKGIKENIPTPFQNLMMFYQSNERAAEIVREGLEFFIHEPITIVPEEGIFIGDLEEELKKAKSIEDIRILREDDYFDFQNLIRDSLGEKRIEAPDPDEHWKVRYFKAKQRLRDRAKKNSKNGLNFSSILAIICCMDLGINPLNIGELSYCSIFILMSYVQDKDKYNIDIQSLLAGADKKKIKLKAWIKNYED